MKLGVCLLVAGCFAGAPAMLAQELKLPPSIEKLADKAEEVVDVTLDGNLLVMAGKFLSDKDPDQAQAKKLVNKIKGIYVKSFQFKKEGMYSEADVEALRAQLKAPGWSCIVKVRSAKSRENADVCLAVQNGNITGVAIVASEPTELTIVHINGSIDPSELNALEGQFGIPKFDGEVRKKLQEKH